MVPLRSQRKRNVRKHTKNVERSVSPMLSSDVDGELVVQVDGAVSARQPRAHLLAHTLLCCRSLTHQTHHQPHELFPFHGLFRC